MHSLLDNFFTSAKDENFNFFPLFCPTQLRLEYVLEWRKIFTEFSLLLNNYVKIFTRLFDNLSVSLLCKSTVWFVQISTWKCTKNWKLFSVCLLIGWQKKPFYSQHVVGMLKECLWSKNKQIIVSLKAVWFYSRQRIIYELCASTYKSFWTWKEKNVLTHCRAIAKRTAVMTCLFMLCKCTFFWWRHEFRVGKNFGCFPERKQRRFFILLLWHDRIFDHWHCD